jgi:hypothetical protein
MSATIIPLAVTRVTITNALQGAPNGNGGTCPAPVANRLPKVGERVTVSPPRSPQYTGEARHVTPYWVTVKRDSGDYRSARVTTITKIGD